MSSRPAIAAPTPIPILVAESSCEEPLGLAEGEVFASMFVGEAIEVEEVVVEVIVMVKLFAAEESSTALNTSKLS